MKKRYAILSFAVMFLFIGSLSGLRAAAEIKAVPVTDGLYLVEGLEGGNVAFLDGSAAWYRLNEMRPHYTYSESTSYLGLWPDRR